MLEIVGIILRLSIYACNLRSVVYNWAKPGLFFYFRSYHNRNIMNDKNVDGVLGT